MNMKTAMIILSLFVATTVVNGQPVQRVKLTALEQIIRESKTPLIVNFWATFCQPCIEELPYFVREVKNHRADSVQLLLVSLDLEDAYPDHIRNFAAKRQWDVPLVWLDETNADYFCPRIDSSWTGSIPASLFIDNKTGYRRFYEQQLPEDLFKAALERMLHPEISPSADPLSGAGEKRKQ